MAGYHCTLCGRAFTGPGLTWIHEDEHLRICLRCADLPIVQRLATLRAQRPISPPLTRAAVPPAAVTGLLLHGLIDMIQERKLAGKDVLAATHKTIAEYLRVRTGLAVEPRHIQSLTLAMRDAGLLKIGGAGIGAPNTYDTREDEMGIDRYWDQVEAFLQAWQLPGADRLAVD